MRVRKARTYPPGRDKTEEKTEEKKEDTTDNKKGKDLSTVNSRSLRSLARSASGRLPFLARTALAHGKFSLDAVRNGVADFAGQIWNELGLGSALGRIRLRR